MASCFVNCGKIWIGTLWLSGSQLIVDQTFVYDRGRGRQVRPFRHIGYHEEFVSDYELLNDNAFVNLSDLFIHLVPTSCVPYFLYLESLCVISVIWSC